MSQQPILSIKPGQARPKAVANLLPCRVHHTGSITPVSSFWSPSETKGGSKEAYFRGRKLQGKMVKLPEQYRGVVVELQQPTLPENQIATQPITIEDDDELSEPVGAMQTTAEFDEMVVWSHEIADSSDSDPYIRGVEEWIQVASQIHTYPQQTRQ